MVIAEVRAAVLLGVKLAVLVLLTKVMLAVMVWHLVVLLRQAVVAALAQSVAMVQLLLEVQAEMA
jgi:hypothetical protein